MQAGAKLEVKNEDDYTPLNGAVEQGQEKVVEILLKSGAKVNVQNKDGNTPLMLATHNGYTNIVS